MLDSPGSPRVTAKRVVSVSGNDVVVAEATIKDVVAGLALQKEGWVLNGRPATGTLDAFGQIRERFGERFGVSLLDD